MKKREIVALLMIIGLLFVLITGCSKEVAPPQEYLDTLIIDRNCPFDNESLHKCCEEECTDYCAEKNRQIFKYEINVKEPVRHCMCWC